MLKSERVAGPLKRQQKTRRTKIGGPKKAPASSSLRSPFESLSLAPLRPSGSRKMAPAAMATEMGSGPSRTDRTRDGVRVVKREFIGNVVNTVGFSLPVAVYNINPGVAAVFPWLSIMANQYETYRFHRLTFRYITRCGTSQSGSVILAPDYDASDSPPTTEQQITAYRGAVEDVPWRDISCTLEPSAMFSLGPRKFIRSSTVAFTDIKTYDAGLFLVATVGVDTNLLGKLWVEYDVELFTPQIPTPGAGLIPTFTSMFVASGQDLIVSNTSVVGFTPVFNPLGIVLTTSGTGTAFTPPRGTYLFTFFCDFNASGSPSANTYLNPSINILKNVSVLVPNPMVGTVVFMYAGTGNWSTQLCLQYVVVCSGSDNVELTAVYSTTYPLVTGYTPIYIPGNTSTILTIQPA